MGAIATDTPFDAAGVKVYEDCRILPRAREGLYYGPCGEGGSVFMSLAQGYRRLVMIFYSPATFTQPVFVASADLATQSPLTILLSSYYAAVEACLRSYWGPPLSLLGLATCLDIHTQQLPGFTGLRGIVIAANASSSRRRGRAWISQRGRPCYRRRAKSSPLRHESGPSPDATSRAQGAKDSDRRSAAARCGLTLPCEPLERFAWRWRSCVTQLHPCAAGDGKNAAHCVPFVLRCCIC